MVCHLIPSVIPFALLFKAKQIVLIDFTPQVFHSLIICFNTLYLCYIVIVYFTCLYTLPKHTTNAIAVSLTLIASGGVRASRRDAPGERQGKLWPFVHRALVAASRIDRRHIEAWLKRPRIYMTSF